MSIGIPFGKYQLTRRLARGGMAEVFLASQRGPGDFERTVAVKRILPHLADIPQFLAMFMDEAQLAAQLSHPNIAHIYEFGQVDDSFFIAMEYIDGVDMSVVVLDGLRRPLPLEHAARIIADVCAALHHAHHLKGRNGKPLGIVHRDISPQNILVSFDGAVKMVDFGIAKAASQIERTRPGVVRGKFTYMSPEQVMGKTLDGRSDLFSAGIVLYELCTCRALFPRTDAVQAMQLIRKAEIPPPARDGTPLPAGLTRIIHRALSRDRDERYQTAAQMQMDLEEFLRSAGISNSILLGEYFSQHYRQPRPEPVAKGTASVAGRGPGTVQVGGLPPVPGPPGTVAVARAQGTLQTFHATDTDVMAQAGLLVESDALHIPPPVSSVSGVIFDQPTEEKDVADTRISLYSTLVGAQGRASAEDTGEMDRATVEISTGPARTISTLNEGAITVNRMGGAGWTPPMAGTTASIRSFGRKLVLGGIVAALAVVAVVLAYLISSPPEAASVADARIPALTEYSGDSGPVEGTLIITSDPGGASISVDGRQLGVTPLRRSLRPGSYLLTTTLAGHADQRQEVSLETGQLLKVRFVLRHLTGAPDGGERVVQLKPAPPIKVPQVQPRRKGVRPRPHPKVVHAVATAGHGYLNITSIPWSWVYLGRQKLGQTPLANVKVPAGTHRLRFSNPAHAEVFRTVKVEPGKTAKLRVTLR